MTTTYTLTREEDGDAAETWQVGRDVRHGVEGWRALRYLPEGDDMAWDGEAMFFPSLAAAVTVLERGEIAAGRAAF